MKKLAILLLAAVMLFTCFAFAACSDDGDTSSDSGKTSSETSTASDDSSAADTSSEEEKSAESAEDSSEAASEEESVADPSEDASEEESEEESTEDPADDSSEEEDVETPAEAESFWITHYDDAEKEGAGMVLTQEDSAGVWCDHYAFKPIDGVENGFELVAFSYGTIANGDATYNGAGEKLELPEGGFIYATSIGNDYPSLGMDGENYVNDSCNEQISRCRTWKVGDQFVITGLDLDGKTIPTTTDDLSWFEDGYVCTATIQKIN